MVGYKGKVKMLQAVFGDGTEKEKPKRKPTADELKDFVKTHNTVLK